MREGIRKVLSRLVKQGVVNSDRIGNAFTYRFNHDHLAAEYIIGLADLQRKLLRRIGLSVRPEGVDDASWEEQVGGLMAEITRWTGNDARPLEYSAAELAARGRDEPVLRDALNDGLTVAGKRSWLNGQLRKG